MFVKSWDHLSELSGKEVYVRGFWISTDVGEMIVPLNPCPRPVIRDGGSWRHLVAIPPSKNLPADPHRLALVSMQRALAERHESEAMVVATFVGRIETSSHFKIRTSASPKKQSATTEETALPRWIPPKFWTSVARGHRQNSVNGGDKSRSIPKRCVPNRDERATEADRGRGLA